MKDKDAAFVPFRIFSLNHQTKTGLFVSPERYLLCWVFFALYFYASLTIERGAEFKNSCMRCFVCSGILYGLQNEKS